MASVERRRNKSSSSGDGLKKSLAKSAQSEANITGKAAKPAAKRRSHRKTDAVRLHQAEMLVNLSRRVAALESLDEVLAAALARHPGEVPAFMSFDVDRPVVNVTSVDPNGPAGRYSFEPIDQTSGAVAVAISCEPMSRPRCRA